ncbi:MAG: glutathione S-transferase N-terminal domain-containing protein [Proteobacteria bacterium]|nr:glutathione S-transferase N-terminal domain-containing protein [Pseudomonadota bacterium]
MPITLYDARGSNGGERVRWALQFKGVAYTRIDIEAPHDRAHLGRISPFGRVPVG